MRKLFTSIAAIVFCTVANAQLTTPANGISVRAKVGERIGLTDIMIEYGRPAVKGREGKIWGDLVHTGFVNQGFGNGKDGPWRAGANENTTIEFSTDVTVEGKKLAAGKYGFFVAYGKDACTIIFSNATSSWGSYFYDEAEDVLRVKVKPVPVTELRERLTFQFGNETDSSARVSLEWEHLAIPFVVSTALHELQMASFARELRGEKGFDPHAMVEVAEYYVAHNTRLEDALSYANSALSSMPTLSNSLLKADILRKMNKAKEADEVTAAAMERATEDELHRYARRLLREGKKEDAYNAFQLNYKHNPKSYVSCIGLVRGCSANGKIKDALKYAQKALPLAPDEANKKATEAMIATLKNGKEI